MGVTSTLFSTLWKCSRRSHKQRRIVEKESLLPLLCMSKHNPGSFTTETPAQPEAFGKGDTVNALGVGSCRRYETFD